MKVQYWPWGAVAPCCVLSALVDANEMPLGRYFFISLYKSLCGISEISDCGGGGVGIGRNWTF